MTTPPAIQNIIEWHQANLGRLVYDEDSSTRLHYATTSDLLTPTDCSGDFIRTFRHFGVSGLEKATYTGNLCEAGNLVTTSLSDAAAGKGLLPGDAVFYHWRGWSLNPGDPFNHVNLYAGGDLVYNHGGPARGPVRQSLRQNVENAQAVMVRRYMQPIAAPVVKPPAGVPAWPWPSSNTADELGNAADPSNHVHGGIDSDSHEVKLCIAAAKHHLKALFPGADLDLSATGQYLWGPGMDAAVLAYRAKYDKTAKGIKTLGRVGYLKLMGTK